MANYLIEKKKMKLEYGFLKRLIDMGHNVHVAEDFNERINFNSETSSETDEYEAVRRTVKS